MKLYKTSQSILLESDGRFYALKGMEWDALVNTEDLHGYLQQQVRELQSLLNGDDTLLRDIKAPISGQEIWAAGVTYLRSKVARMEESKVSGGADFYAKVYEAERPELFFKSTAARCAGSGEDVYIRRDSGWNVPEPELTLFANAAGKIVGYTIGNDMSSRDIEGENPLYLPQAKSYDRAAAIGPCLWIPGKPIDPETAIRMQIRRQGEEVFAGQISISQMKRTHEELMGYLFREMSFPQGVYLMTGTCLVPPNEFTLQPDDQVSIAIDGIGVLENRVAVKQLKSGVVE